MARHIDPDILEKNNEVYWGAVLAQAIRNGDPERIELARTELHRLGIHLDVVPRDYPRREAVDAR